MLRQTGYGGVVAGVAHLALWGDGCILIEKHEKENLVLENSYAFWPEFL